VLLLKVPTGHFKQRRCLGTGEYEPAGQASQAVEEADVEMKPAGQSKQLANAEALEKVPASQNSTKKEGHMEELSTNLHTIGRKTKPENETYGR